MKKNYILKALSAIGCLSGGIFIENAKAQLPLPSHIIIVMMENHAYTQIIGSSSAPYINSLLTDSTALFTQSYGLTHPSQPNYIMLFSGDNQGVITDNQAIDTPFTTCNLGASLLAGGFTFTGYSEDLPSVGSLVTTSGNYAKKHSPWSNWQGALSNGIPATDNQPYTNFPTSYSSLSTVSFVIPNLSNDMHYPLYLPSAISAGDTWLQTNMDGYIQWAKTNNSLFILTFDEDDDFHSNRIATLIIGQGVKPGSYSETIDHYCILRTIEDMYGLSHCGNSANAAVITDCWKQITTGINQNTASDNNIYIYPNPFSSKTIIEINGLQSPVLDYAHAELQLQIIDLLGREVYKSVITNPKSEIDRGELKSGVYFAQLVSSHTGDSRRKIIAIEKIVIQ